MKSMTIGKRLFISQGAALALTLAVSILSLWALYDLGSRMEKVIKVNARKLYLATDILRIQSDLVSAERGIIARAFIKDKVTSQQYQQEFARGVAQMKGELAEAAPLVETVEGRHLIGEIQDKADQFVQYHEELYRYAINDQANEAIDAAIQKTIPVRTRITEDCRRLQQDAEALMVVAGKEVEASVAQGRWIIIALVVLSLMVAVVAAFISRQIRSSLLQAVSELTEGAEQTASAASQVSSSSQSLAQGSSEQAASLQETSASAEQVSSGAKKNADSTRQMAADMEEARNIVATVSEGIRNTQGAMLAINSSSDNIAKIIKVIDEVAFQTNILALNAAVEAARAGEAGMGFAVVADEVRNLAQRSASAAKEIGGLIEEAVQKSKAGRLKVDEVSKAMEANVAIAARIGREIDEVSVASQQQTRGLEQITTAIAQIEQVTHTTAANAEESAAAAEQLNAQSEALRSIAEHLNAMVGGGGVDARKATAHRAVRARGQGPAAKAHRHSKSDVVLAALGRAVSHGNDGAGSDA